MVKLLEDSPDTCNHGPQCKHHYYACITRK